jgi:sortase A
MARKKTLEELSSDELRQLLVEKRRAERESRLDAYRKSGRVIRVAGEQSAAPTLAELEDEEEEKDSPSDLRKRAKARRKSTLDKLLYGVEIVAILGLFFILFNGAKVLTNLNKEFSNALNPGEQTPSALITAVVLPSGHTPPVAGVEVRPNTSEIPEHLQAIMQTYENLPIPTPGPQAARQMQIPKISVNAPVVMGDNWEQLKKGIGQHLNTANPGQKGNMVVSAHNDIFGELFKDLDKLQPGDEVIVITQDRSYTYVVTGTQIVNPTDVSVMDPTDDATLTLISCYPYRTDNKRIIVTAVLDTNS